MTDLKQTLDKQDKAATPGEWLADCHHIRLIEGRAAWDSDEQANVRFIVTLVNAYRSGHLIVKPDREAGSGEVAGPALDASRC